MVRIQLADDSTRLAWEAYVAHSSQAQIGHQFIWRGVLSEVFGIQPYYWIAVAGDRLMGVAPFFLRRHLGLGARLTSVPYLNTGGILADDAATQKALWEHICGWGVQHKIDSIEMRFREQPLPGIPVRVGRSVSIIPLPTTHQAAWDQMRSTARNRIRKAEKSGLQIAHGFGGLDGFWGAYADNMRFLGAPVLPYRFFERLATTPALGAHLITVVNNRHALGGMILLRFVLGAENGWTAARIAARDQYVNDLLYWHAIQWAIDQGLAWLDLGRSEAGGGHERFKEKFGAQSVALPYQELERAATDWQARTQEPEALYKAFRSVWRRLPVPLATQLGPYVSRQVY